MSLNKLNKKIMNCIPELWKAWFLKYINLIEVPEEIKNNTFCGVRLNNKKIEMIVDSQRLLTFPDEELLKLIQHEIAHIVRGDILIGKEFDRKIVNISCDAIINEILNINNVNGIEGMTIKYLQQIFPEIPDNPAGWRQIYNIIIKNTETIKLFIYNMDIFPSDDPDKEEILTDIVLDLILNDQEVTKLCNIKSRTHSENIKIKIVTSKLLENIIRRIKSHFGNKIKARSYRKEHPASDMLKNVSRIPVNKILIVLDVSGSYIEYTSTIMGLIYWIRKSKSLVSDIGVFSDNFNIIPEARINSIPGYGGSTYINGMFSYLEKNKYDLVIVFTDGEIFDYTEELRSRYKGKILWILDKNDNYNIYKKGTDDVLINDKVFKSAV